MRRSARMLTMQATTEMALWSLRSKRRLRMPSQRTMAFFSTGPTHMLGLFAVKRKMHD